MKDNNLPSTWTELANVIKVDLEKLAKNIPAQYLGEEKTPTHTLQATLNQQQKLILDTVFLKGSKVRARKIYFKSFKIIG